ncbi:MAG: adenylate kinase family protein [Thermoplasmata archaeon]
MRAGRKKQRRRKGLIAVSGTPGTGKSLACSYIRNPPVIDLNRLIKKNAKKFALDSDRESIEVSPAELKRLVPDFKGKIIVEGHLSHLLNPEKTIVLRCSPRELGKRLRRRGWSESKIRENQEAEAVDVILIEALAGGKSGVFEIDTTNMKPKEVAEAIREIIEGKDTRRFRPGKIDWSEEVLGWY